MSKVEERPRTTSFRWKPSREEDFLEAVENFQEQGEVPEGLSRSEAIRRVLNSWSEDPDSDCLS